MDASSSMIPRSRLALHRKAVASRTRSRRATDRSRALRFSSSLARARSRAIRLYSSRYILQSHPGFMSSSAAELFSFFEEGGEPALPGLELAVGSPPLCPLTDDLAPASRYLRAVRPCLFSRCLSFEVGPKRLCSGRAFPNRGEVQEPISNHVLRGPPHHEEAVRRPGIEYRGHSQYQVPFLRSERYPSVSKDRPEPRLNLPQWGPALPPKALPIPFVVPVPRPRRHAQPPQHQHVPPTPVADAPRSETWWPD